jgi:hypothetical protein
MSIGGERVPISADRKVRIHSPPVPSLRTFERTATLDQQTAEALIGDIGVGQESSTRPRRRGSWIDVEKTLGGRGDLNRCIREFPEREGRR